MRCSEDDEVVEFLRFLKEQETPKVLADWVDFALDHRTGSALRVALFRLKSYPNLENGWWNERMRLEEERIAEIARAARYPR